jgi:hypothetical protein
MLQDLGLGYTVHLYSVVASLAARPRPLPRFWAQADGIGPLNFRGLTSRRALLAIHNVSLAYQATEWAKDCSVFMHSPAIWLVYSHEPTSNIIS